MLDTWRRLGTGADEVEVVTAMLVPAFIGFVDVLMIEVSEGEFWFCKPAVSAVLLIELLIVVFESRPVKSMSTGWSVFKDSSVGVSDWLVILEEDEDKEGLEEEPLIVGVTLVPLMPCSITDNKSHSFLNWLYCWGTAQLIPIAIVFIRRFELSVAVTEAVEIAFERVEAVGWDCVIIVRDFERDEWGELLEDWTKSMLFEMVEDDVATPILGEDIISWLLVDDVLLVIVVALMSDENDLQYSLEEQTSATTVSSQQDLLSGISII